MTPAAKQARDLILIRGLPGSGKSTLADKLEGYHLEADQFFMTGGTYRFDATKLKAAHECCQQQARSYLEAGASVVVSNTFTTLKEMQPYLDMAAETGARLTVLTVNGNYGSVHNVPAEVISKMRQRWEEYPVRALDAEGADECVCGETSARNCTVHAEEARSLQQIADAEGASTEARQDAAPSGEGLDEAWERYCQSGTIPVDGNPQHIAFEAGYRAKAQPPASQGEAWQPIESAPKDGTMVLFGLWVKSTSTGKKSWSQYLGHVTDNGDVEDEYGSDFGWLLGDFDSWMPLPAAPVNKGA